MDDEKIIRLLEEIRDNQRQALEHAKNSQELSRRSLDLYESHRAEALKNGRKAARLIVLILALVIALLVIGPLSRALTCRQSAKQSASTWQPKVFSPAAKLTVSNVEAHQRGANAIFLGKVSNDGPDSWQTLTLEVSLLDETGSTIDKCAGYLSGLLRPGAAREFKIDCGGRQDNPTPSYKRFEASVVDAYPEYSAGEQ